MNTTDSATGGLYVDVDIGGDSTFIEWNVDVPNSGDYLVSFRYGLDYNPRPLNLFVNGEELVYSPSLNSPGNITNIGGNPTASYPLGKCAGDCDSDSQCADGLFCFHRDETEPIPTSLCNEGVLNNGWDYCVDVNDFVGVVALPTGSWSNGWHYTEPVQVTLLGGVNSIRLQFPFPISIDNMRIEGLDSSTPSSSFRNPPHFMSIIPDYSPYGLGERNVRDAQYETEATLDHYFYQDNVAPFLCIRMMQRFSFSNPSPGYVKRCSHAFTTGLYESMGGVTFGSGVYGSLASMIASILLDKEATDSAIMVDPSHGSLKEPLLKVTHLMRSMEYATSIPTTLDGNLMQTTYNDKLWLIDEKIGHGPYEVRTTYWIVHKICMYDV